MTVLMVTLVAPCTYAQNQNFDEMPVYKGDNTQFGELRIWGNNALMNVLRNWEIGIKANGQRGLFFVDTLGSGAQSIGPLYTGLGDFGLMGHHGWPVEMQGFYDVFGYEPTEIIVGSGGYDVKGTMPANVIYVTKNNPLAKLTMKQLDGIFGEQRSGGWEGRKWSTAGARSAKENIRTWGQLGLTGEWADKPIHVYGYDVTGSSFPFSMQRMVFKGGDKWTPDLRELVLNEVGLMYTAGPSPKEGCELLIEALAKDPYGISYTAVQCASKNPDVKPLAIAATDAGPYIEPTKANFLNRTYPLVESIYTYINRPPGKPVEPKLREFLRYVLSRQGQQDVLRDGGYLPLTAEAVREELKKIE